MTATGKDISASQLRDLRLMMEQLERGELIGMLPSDGSGRTPLPEESGYIDQLFDAPERQNEFFVEEGMMNRAAEREGTAYHGIATDEERWDRSQAPSGDSDHYTWVHPGLAVHRLREGRHVW